jgi:glycine hydroxymethyltransferase
MVQVADWMHRALLNRRDEQEIAKIRSEVKKLCERFPIYPDLYQEQD